MINYRYYFIIIFQAFLVYGYCNYCDSLLINWSKDKNLPFEKRKLSIIAIIQEADSKNDFRCVADAYRRLGTLYKVNGLLDSAIRYYVLSLNFAKETNYLDSQASTLNQIAIVYSHKKQSKLTRYYFQEAFKAYQQIPDYRGMSAAIFNIAELQFNNNYADSAYLNCIQSLNYMRRWEDTVTVGYNYDLLSKIELKKNNTGNAKHFSKTAIQLLRQDGDISGLLPALSQLAKIHIRLKAQDSALKYLNQAFKLADSLGYRQNAYELTSELASCYEGLERFDSANRYLKIHQSLSDFLNNETHERVGSEMLAKFDTERKEAEIQYHKELSSKRKAMNIVLSVVSISLALFLIFLWLSLNQRKKIRQKESELNQANALLRGQDEERGRIARELHDRVGSMISTIKLHFSAMEEQMAALTEEHRNYEKAISLLDETYEEVRRISNDLDTGLLGRFGLRTAMLKLIQLIQSTNKLQMQYIDNNLEPELYKKFEADLYRITQELLSNTIKYAGAKEVSIQLSRNNGNLVYSYEDDGKGFDKELLEQSSGLGYRNINARVRKMKGSWHLDTSPGHGLNLIIEMPLSEDKDHYR